MKIYFASPLFSEMEQQYNQDVVDRIRETYGELVNIYLPQENADINDKKGYADSIAIAKADTDELLSSGLVIAVLDGVTIDSGVSAEIGVAFANNIPVIGIYTDVRQQGTDNVNKINAISTIAENQFSYINLYTVGLIKQNGVIVNSSFKAIQEINNYM